MRKIIETTSTLLLWGVFIVGSTTAISDFFLNAEISQKMSTHLRLLAWSPAIALVIFGMMMVAVRRSKFNSTTKKKMVGDHTVPWSTEELANAQNGKVVDLHFSSPGLACEVVARQEMAEVLHAENQQVHVKVLPPLPEPTTQVAKAFSRRRM